MIGQEQLFQLWGLSKRARGNLLYIFIAALFSAIAYLWYDGKAKEALLQKCNEEMVKATERFEERIGKEKDARLEDQKEMRKYFQKQAEIERAVKKNAERIEKALNTR